LPESEFSSTPSSGDTAAASEPGTIEQTFAIPVRDITFISGPESVEEAVRYVLKKHGLEGEHFEKTPERFARMFAGFNQPVDLEAILSTGFEETNDNIMVVQTNIPFRGLCAHHLLPFFGTAAVGYIPRGRVVGLSKLTRLVQAAGTLAPSTQEHITNVVADTLFRTMECIGVGVVTSALHGCMAVRGVNAPRTETRVSALRGQMLLNPTARGEFMEMIK
jgi:GTP cyclohydrolase I